MPTIAAMRKFCAMLLFLGTIPISGGCGLVYQAGSAYRANKMEKTLSPGLTIAEVHNSWGEPDIRTYVDAHSEVWSYAKHANSDDVTATLLYTSAKEGDQGPFLDLKFNDGRLVSCSEAHNTMPPN